MFGNSTCLLLPFYQSTNLINLYKLRFKISLEVLPQVSGNVLPISYQYELATAFHHLLTHDQSAYASWLEQNGLLTLAQEGTQLYALSNLYVPRIFVEGDRLHVNVPWIQLWISFLPEIGTFEFLMHQLQDQQIVVGDSVSEVAFNIKAIEEVSPVSYLSRMEYQTLSPVVVKAVRQNGTLEYLAPSNPYFAEFLVESLIERWERLHGQKFYGNPSYRFTLLVPERRKAVNIMAGDPMQHKVVGYMLKFRLEMNPELQELAYVLGIGDETQYGFGYLELLKKRK